MAGRDRITFGLAIIVAILAMLAREHVLVQTGLAAFAVFLIIWGREPRGTEEFLKRVPGGSFALKALEQLDLILSPRDREYERHIRSVITGYDAEQRKALRELWRTRTSTHTPNAHFQRFQADGLIDLPKDGPGWIKSDLRSIVGRTLDEVGA
jgi:hypothetical protein